MMLNYKQKLLHVHLHAEDQSILLQQYIVSVCERGRSLDKFCGSLLLHKENATLQILSAISVACHTCRNELQWFRGIYHERRNVKCHIM
jgi:LSD1 subclass zinc finger protein